MPAHAQRKLPLLVRPAPAAARSLRKESVSEVPQTKLAAELHEWAFRAGREASPRPREFLADLPRWLREAKDGFSKPVAELRVLSIRVAEGIALMRSHENERAAESLETTLRAFERVFERGVPPGTEREVRLWHGGVKLSLGTVARQRGDYRLALQWLREAADEFQLIDERTKYAVALGNMANVFGEVGMFDDQLRLALEARATLLALGNPMHAAMQSFNLAETHLARGDFVAAQQCCRDAEREWIRGDRAELALQARIQLALVDVKRGRASAALTRLERLAAPCAAAACRAIAEPLRLEALGKALVALQRWPQAAQAYDAALQVLRSEPSLHHEGRLWIELGRVRLQLGELDAAAAAARRALERFAGVGVAESGVIDAEALLSSVAQQRGDWKAAWQHESRRREAYELFFERERDRRAAVLAAQHQLDLARAEAERQGTENARLSEALSAVAARLRLAHGGVAGGSGNGGANPARASGETAGTLPENPASLRPLGLTKRESEVLWWIAEGKTNDEICTILGTSLANVKKQLQNIYTKLGVENRTAAAGRALRHLRGG